MKRMRLEQSLTRALGSIENSPPSPGLGPRRQNKRGPRKTNAKGTSRTGFCALAMPGDPSLALNLGPNQDFRSGFTMDILRHGCKACAR